MRAALAGFIFFTGAAQALQVTSISPQGEVARVRQIVAKFDAPAVTFGDPKAQAPVALSCSDAQATTGTGRWTSDRQWVFDFENDLPPGIRCSVTAKPGFASPQGAALATGNWRFTTGGPFVQELRPGDGRIDEEQFFALRLNGPATPQSLQQFVSCSVEGLGERVPVRLLAPAEREALFKALNMDKAAAKEPQRYVALACNRRLPPNARVQLVYGKGVATPSGVANSVEKRYDFTVREPFAVSFSCERENAQAACLPIRPMSLAFNAPVPRKTAEQIRLKSGKLALEPQFDADTGADGAVESVTFKGVLPERTEFTLELPKDFRDASGRPLRNPESFPLKVATGPMPPLAKFAAAPFGIVERFAEPDSGPLLPVTLRNVEPALRTQALTPGRVGDLSPRTDAEILAWIDKLTRYEQWNVPRDTAKLEVRQPLPRVLKPEDKDQVEARMLSLLAGQPGVRAMELPRPAADEPRPFEVVGIPLTPGFHVVEIASPLLGRSLLDDRHGAQRTMYVRTSALVTNIAVHFKLGRENAMAWVTTLDKGTVVAGATVRVSSCDGKQLATA
ncbi:MAG TPA: alpha-2-macroglobulin, partial [Ramlibacter sp.]